MPFGSKSRITCCQVIYAFDWPLSAAKGALIQFLRAVIDPGLPFMPLGALPPDSLVAARKDVLGLHGAVLRRMPLSCDFREASGEVI